MLLRLRLIPLLTLILMLGGCTAAQQDALLAKLVEMGRSNAGLTLHTANLSDTAMTYLERPGTGPVVFLVHGFSANKDTWLKLVPELPSDWHLIVPDLAGHGDSIEDANADFLLTSQARRLDELRKSLGVKQIHIVGNSMGGAIVMIYAALYPRHSASLTLMDAAGMNAPQPSEYMQALARGENPLIATDAESFDYRWNFVMSKRPPLFWPIRPAMIRETLKRETINRRIFADMLASQALLNEEFIAQLKAVHIPVLIQWGEEDRVLDKSAISEFKRYLPQATSVVYPGIGHLPMVEAPEQTAQDLTHFIQSL